MSYVYGLQNFALWFSEANIFRAVTEKVRGRLDYVLMDGHVLFLKQPNKLFEAKLFVNFTFFHLFYFLEVFATIYVFHN